MFYFLLCVFNQQKEVKLLRWAGPEGSKVKSYEEWISENPLKPFKFSIKRFYNIKSGETVAIITEQDIYNSISSELNQLISDLEEQKLM
jgi:hypothetical protein